MKKTIFNFALLLAAILLALLLSEILLVAFLPIKEKRTRYMRVRQVFHYEKPHVRFDSDLGYMTKANLKIPFLNFVTCYQKEFATLVETNSAGFRDDEASLHNPDIFLLGDSFGFGWGVEKSESCEKILEDSCHVKVLNMSVPGYGTIQQFLLLRRWSQVHEVSGKTALFLFFQNDLQDNLRMTVYPALSRRDGTTFFLQPSAAGFQEWVALCSANQLRGMSRLSYVTYLLEYGSMKLWRELNHPGADGKKETAADSSIQEEFQIFGLIIDAIRIFALAQKLNIIFVYVPPQNDDKNFSKIAGILSAAAIPLVDLRSALSKNDYYKYDGHWKPAGQYKAAMAIKHFLK